MKIWNIAPVGRCIYCGSAADLSDEHIIPYALNGKWGLPDASCKSCSMITSQFEGNVLRGPLLPARSVTQFSTRHPRNRPTEYPIIIDGKPINVTSKDLVATVHLPIILQAAYFDGREYTSGIVLIGVENIVFGKDNLHNYKENNTIKIISTYNYIDFFRMIGKIGYSYAVANYGLLAIKKTYILPSILGETDDIGKWIGSENFISEAKYWRIACLYGQR